MITVAKILCLAPLLLAITGPYLPILPSALISGARLVAVLLLAAHTAELLVAYKYIKWQPGHLIDGITLTLIFGLLHWGPLVKKTAKSNIV